MFLLIIFLGVRWGVISVAATRGTLSPGVEPGFTLEFFKDALFHAALPILTYVLTTIGSWMLTMKSSTISVLEEDYVTVAKAKGLKESRITTTYVGRNASLPMFTLLTIAIGFVVGGSVLIETIFQYQGIGYILLQSVNKRDYTVMQGVFLVITLSVIVANFFADNDRITLYNFYNGMPLSEEVKVLSYKNGILRIKTSLAKAAFLKNEPFTFFKHPQLPDTVKADVANAVPNRAEVVLTNLRFIDKSPVDRENIRVMPDERIEVFIECANGEEIVGTIHSLAVNSLAIKLENMEMADFCFSDDVTSCRVTITCLST